jgi:hypothetical protein
LPIDLRLAQAQALVGGRQNDFRLGPLDGFDEQLLVVGRRGAEEQDVDADDPGTGSIDCLDELRQQGGRSAGASCIRSTSGR